MKRYSCPKCGESKSILSKVADNLFTIRYRIYCSRCKWSTLPVDGLEPEPVKAQTIELWNNEALKIKPSGYYPRGRR